MVVDNTSPFATNFTVSIEAAEGVTTGISAYDRAHTIRTAVRPDAKPADLTQPGHIFPLMAQPGGVLTRTGHTEAAADLALLAGFEPAGVLVEVLSADGGMARQFDQLLDAGEFVRTLQHRQGIQIACLEEIAFEMGFITAEQARTAGERFKKTAYGRAILNAVEGR